MQPKTLSSAAGCATPNDRTATRRNCNTSQLAGVAYQNFTTGIQHTDSVPALGKGDRDVDGVDQNILLTGNRQPDRCDAGPAEGDRA